MLSLVLTLALTQSSGVSLSQGRAHVKALRTADLSVLWAKLNRGEHDFSSFSKLERLATQLRHFGAESKVISESLGQRDGHVLYTRVAAVTGWARGVVVHVEMNERGQLVDADFAFATDEAPTTYGAYRSLVKLTLPLEDDWDVLWGGRSYEDNRHASVSDMRFALDLWRKRKGSTSEGRGTKNSDYFAYGQHVLAPADGRVVAIVDGIEDNQPQHARPGNLYGNYVVIDHGTEEFTLLAHLQPGAFTVKVGERVARGQRLARVGNSGMSTEPHLHFQLMDTADWRTAHGLPLVLHQVLRQGTLVDRFEPRRGDVLRALPSEARR